MSDRDRDPHPDSLPEVDSDVRSDIERAVEEATDGELETPAADETPPEPTGAGGMTKDQGLTPQ
jgi:hypothetical protein